MLQTHVHLTITGSNSRTKGPGILGSAPGSIEECVLMGTDLVALFPSYSKLDSVGPSSSTCLCPSPGCS